MLPFYSCFMVQRYILYLNNKTNLLKYLEVIEILRIFAAREPAKPLYNA